MRWRSLRRCVLLCGTFGTFVRRPVLIALGVRFFGIFGHLIRLRPVHRYRPPPHLVIPSLWDALVLAVKRRIRMR